MIGGADFTSQRIGSFYNQNQNALAETLMRLSSGKKFQGPGDDIAGYVRVQSLQSNITGYERIKQNLSEYSAVLDTAITGGEELYDSLTRLKELSDLYNNTSDTTEQAAYEKEYDQIRGDLSTTINSLTYRGTALTGNGTGATHTVATIDVDPGSGTQNITIALPDIMDTSTIETNLSNAGAAADIDTVIGSVQTFLATASATQRTVDSQLNIVNSAIQTHEAAQSAIQDIDEAEELSKYTEQDIRSQAAISMMAQANVSRRAVLTLYQ
jgi:flagellin